eukprot:439047-Alexandrium_andersonii.AAC.1
MACSLLITVLPYEFVIEDVTLNQLYDEVSWSLRAADLGRHPYIGSDGQPIQGWRPPCLKL